MPGYKKDENVSHRLPGRVQLVLVDTTTAILVLDMVSQTIEEDCQGITSITTVVIHMAIIVREVMTSILLRIKDTTHRTSTMATTLNTSMLVVVAYRTHPSCAPSWPQFHRRGSD